MYSSELYLAIKEKLKYIIEQSNYKNDFSRTLTLRALLAFGRRSLVANIERFD